MKTVSPKRAFWAGDQPVLGWWKTRLAWCTSEFRDTTFCVRGVYMGSFSCEEVDLLWGLKSQDLGVYLDGFRSTEDT